jgi:hypothetical protein
MMIFINPYQVLAIFIGIFSVSMGYFNVMLFICKAY